MNIFTCLVVFRIFDITTAIKSKSVNLALETVLEFNKRDNTGDVQFIDNVQTFLNRIKSIINKKQDGRRANSNMLDENFTGFLKNVIAILKNYDDEDLEDVFAVIDNELRKYHYKGCKFYELIQNSDVRRYMAVKLNDVRSKSADEIRHALKYAYIILLEENYDRRVKELLDYINSLYRSGAKYKFRSFLNNLENYKSKSKRASMDLIKIVREGVRSILFDHYTDLNQNARRELKLKIETFWKEMSNPHYIRHKVWNIKYTRSSSNKFGFDVITMENNMENKVSVTNGSTTTKRKKWTFPTKLPFNLTRPNITKINSTTTKKPTTTTKKKTKKPKKPKKPKKMKHDSMYSNEKPFVTLYKQDRTHRPHRYRTRGRERLHTLWEEELVVSAKKPVKTIISNHEAEINVERTEKPKHHKKNHDRNRHSKHRKPLKKIGRYHQRFYRRYSSPKFRILKHSPATPSFRKFAPLRITSDEGMSIESFENVKLPQKKITFRRSNINDTVAVTNVVTVDNNVMRRINDLEKEVNDMKSKIKINEPTTTTATRAVEENYALDFWEGTPKFEYTNSETTTNKPPIGISTTAPNAKRSENVTEAKLSTVTSMMKVKNIFIPVNVKQFENRTRDGAVLNKISFFENKTKVIPFFENNGNVTITVQEMKNDLFAMKNNFTATPVLKIDAKTSDSPSLEKNVTDTKMLVDESISKQIQSIFMNLTTRATPSNTILPHLVNISIPPGFENPFEDIDNMDFL